MIFEKFTSIEDTIYLFIYFNFYYTNSVRAGFIWYVDSINMIFIEDNKFSQSVFCLRPCMIK